MPFFFKKKKFEKLSSSEQKVLDFLQNVYYYLVEVTRGKVWHKEIRALTLRRYIDRPSYVSPITLRETRFGY